MLSLITAIGTTLNPHSLDLGTSLGFLGGWEGIISCFVLYSDTVDCKWLNDIHITKSNTRHGEILMISMLPAVCLIKVVTFSIGSGTVIFAFYSGMMQICFIIKERGLLAKKSDTF